METHLKLTFIRALINWALKLNIFLFLLFIFFIKIVDILLKRNHLLLFFEKHLLEDDSFLVARCRKVWSRLVLRFGLDLLRGILGLNLLLNNLNLRFNRFYLWLLWSFIILRFFHFNILTFFFFLRSLFWFCFNFVWTANVCRSKRLTFYFQICATFYGKLFSNR